MSTPNRDIAADRATVEAHTSRLLETAQALDPASVSDPSLCVGWSRGHVLTHVARNADALVNLVTSATTGKTIPMYASQDARDADIEAGSGRPIAAQLDDLEASAGRWRAAVETLRVEHADVQVEARGGTMIKAGYLPFMRLREVVFHHVDLGAGFGFADVEGPVLLAFLEDSVRRLRNNAETPSMTVRTDAGDAWSIGDGQPTVSGSRAAVLAWLARGLTDGVEGDLPALPAGN